MRVAFFTESYEPVVNGVTRSIETFREALADLGHEVHVYAPAYPHYQDESEFVHRFPSFALPMQPDYPISFPIAPKLEAEFSRMRFELVHTHTPFVLGMVGRHLGRANMLPVISTNHTLYVEYAHYARYMPGMVTRTYLEYMMKTYYNSVDFVTVPSQATAKLLAAKYGVVKPIRVVPTGIPKNETSQTEAAAARAELGISSETKFCLFVGRLAVEKNVWLLLRAWKLIQETLPQTTLAIVGSGPLREEVETRVDEMGLRSSVHLTGFLKQEGVRRLLAAADLLLHPSLTETQGLVLGEAQAAGCPQVACDAMGAHEQVIDGVTGFLTPNDPGEFAAAALRCLTDEERLSAMRRACRVRWEGITPRAAALKLAEAYREAADRVCREAIPA